MWGAGGIKVPFQLFIIPKTCPGIQARETKHVQSQRTFIFYAVSQDWTTISLGKNKTISDGGITNFLQYYIGVDLESLLQYYSFERKMEG